MVTYENPQEIRQWALEKQSLQNVTEPSTHAHIDPNISQYNYYSLDQAADKHL